MSIVNKFNRPHSKFENNKSIFNFQSNMLFKGKSKLLKDLSANTLQTLIIQIFSLLIFYLSSIYLNKEEFGEYSWLLAIATTIFTLFSLGMENIIVKKWRKTIIK